MEVREIPYEPSGLLFYRFQPCYFFLFPDNPGSIPKLNRKSPRDQKPFYYLIYFIYLIYQSRIKFYFIWLQAFVFTSFSFIAVI